MKKSIILFSTFAILLTLISSCKKEYFDMDKMRQDQWVNVNMQVPVVNTSLVLRDVLKDYDHEKLFEVDDEGFLSLIYHKDVYSSYAKDFIVLPAQTFPTDNLTDSDVNGGATINRVITDFGSFTNGQLDSIRYDTLEITITVSNDFTNTGGLIVQFPGLTKNGSMAQIPITNLNGETKVEFYGYELNLSDNPSPNNYNTIKFNYIFDSSWNGNSGEQVSIKVGLTKNDYKIINGYIGQHDIPLPADSVHLDIFDKEFEGQFYFKNPKIQLNTINFYGLPIKFNVDTIYGKDFDGNQSPYYNLGIEMDPIAYPSIKGEYEKDSAIVDTISFPEIRELITYKPKFMHFDGRAVSNPHEIVKNYIIDTSRLDVNVKFILPLWGYAEYPTLTDTTELDIEEQFSKLDDVDYLKIKLFVNNGLAARVRIQAYFIDSLGVIQDSLFSTESQQIVIEGGFTDDLGRVIQKRNKVTEIVFTRDRIEKMEHVKNLVYVAIVSTDNIEELKNVKFYANDAIDLKMGFHIKGGTNLDFSQYSDTTS